MVDKKQLTLIQNTCAARIFLNIFGLILGDVSQIDECSKIEILDQKNNQVGQLYFKQGKVIMFANDNDSVLEASFDIPTMGI